MDKTRSSSVFGTSLVYVWHNFEKDVDAFQVWGDRVICLFSL